MDVTYRLKRFSPSLGLWCAREDGAEAGVVDRLNQGERRLAAALASAASHLDVRVGSVSAAERTGTTGGSLASVYGQTGCPWHPTGPADSRLTAH